MNMLSNEIMMPESLGFWVTEDSKPMEVYQSLNTDSMEESIFLCEEEISDEELMSMIAGQRNI